MKPARGIQYPMVVVQALAFDEATGAAEVLCTVPASTIIDHVDVVVDGVWSAAATAEIGDADEQGRLASVDLAALGTTESGFNGFVYTEGADLTVRVSAGTYTSGSARIYIHYVLEDRANEVQA